MITIKAEVQQNKQRSDGMYNVKVRFTLNRQIKRLLKALVFKMDAVDEFHNKAYDVFDVVPNNVLYGIDNDLYFIDNQIRLREI